MKQKISTNDATFHVSRTRVNIMAMLSHKGFTRTLRRQPMRPTRISRALALRSSYAQPKPHRLSLRHLQAPELSLGVYSRRSPVLWLSMYSEGGVSTVIHQRTQVMRHPFRHYMVQSARKMVGGGIQWQ